MQCGGRGEVALCVREHLRLYIYMSVYCPPFFSSLSTFLRFHYASACDSACHASDTVEHFVVSCARDGENFLFVCFSPISSYAALHGCIRSLAASLPLFVFYCFRCCASPSSVPRSPPPPLTREGGAYAHFLSVVRWLAEAVWLSSLECEVLWFSLFA